MNKKIYYLFLTTLFLFLFFWVLNRHVVFAQSGLAGDIDGNGSVNLVDLSILLSNFGKTGVTPSQGDTNGDGNVTLTDLSALLSNFGKTSPTTTPTPTSLPATPTPTITQTPTPTQIPATPTPAPVTSAVFSIGKGVTDVIPRQIVRANNDKVYVFTASVPSGSTLRAYKTTSAGLPTATSSFVTAQDVSVGSTIISTDAVHDGSSTVHVLVNLANGELRDYPFTISTETFKSAIQVATGLPTPSTEIGTSGISGMFDKSNQLHIAHWSSGNHITYRAYTYNSSSNALTIVNGPTQLDGSESGNNANHPVIAVSPVDNTISVSWVAGTNGAGSIYLRTKNTSGTWSGAQKMNTSDAWTSPDSGINIDQGPSLLIDANGARHLAYIENWRAASPYDYGRIHYVTNQSGSYVDSYIGSYSHDPALALKQNGDVYIVGHGHLLNTSCLSIYDMCTIKKNTNGTWANPQLFISASGNQGYDSSPSVKWGVVGWNRPEAIEFLFFRTDNGYSDTSIMYGRF